MRGCKNFKHSKYGQLSSWVPGDTDPSWTTISLPPEKAGPMVAGIPKMHSWGENEGIAGAHPGLMQSGSHLQAVWLPMDCGAQSPGLGLGFCKPVVCRDEFCVFVF